MPRKAKAKKAKPAAKKSGMPDNGTPEPPVLPDKPEHEIELHAVADSKAYTATVHGKRAAVCFTERNRSDAVARFNSVTVRTLADAQALAKAESLPLMIGLQVTVKDKWSSGWLVPFEIFKKLKNSDSDFSLSIKARSTYAAPDSGCVLGVRFTTK